MNSSARWGISVAMAGLVALVIAAGCQNKPQNASQPSAEQRPDQTQAVAPALLSHGPVTTEPIHDDGSGTADVLAQKTAAYARNMETLLPRRLPAEPAPVAPAIDPDAMRLTDSVQKAPTAAPPPAAEPPPGDAGQSILAASVNPAHEAPPAVAAPAPQTDDFAARLARQVHDDPQDIAAQLDYQLLQMLQGQSTPQLPVLAPLDPEDRELLSAIMDGLSNFREGVRADNNMLLSRKVRPMLEMADRLRSQAELSIPTVALCKRVSGFGVYDPIEGERFAAGVEQPVIVYCEVENFASQLNNEKMWETRLKQEVVLYTEQNGLEVWRQKESKPVVDLSRNRRHDFYIVQMIRLPATLTIGRYLLKITVEDLQVNRIAESTAPIEIVAQ